MASDTRHSADAAIRSRVLELPEIANAKCVLTYIGMPPEVDTRDLIDALLAKGVAVLAPLMNDSDVVMTWGQVLALDHLVQAPFGMLQPPEDSLTTPPADAPVLVPCVAFTKQCERLGRGGGHFDRFLAGHSGKRIGLAYELQLANSVPIEPHDVLMDLFVTEKQIYRRS